MAFWRRDQVGSNFIRANVIEISGDPKWSDGLIAASALFVSLSENGRASDERQGENSKEFEHDGEYVLVPKSFQESS